MSEVEAPSGSDHQSTCDLCGLSLRRGRVAADIAGKTHAFCCSGCRQVFAVLWEASDSGDPADFKESKLYKECVAAGILPANEADLDCMAKGSAEPCRTSGEPQPLPAESDASCEATLELNLKVTNMWCPACAWLIDVALKKTPGVLDSRCDFATDRLGIRYNPVRTSPDRIIAEIAKLGYRTAEPGHGQPVLAQKKDFIRFGICAFLTMNVMMLSFALYSGFFIELTADNIANISWPMMTMTAAVLGYGGYDFFRKAFSGICNFSPSMETLIIIGATSAFGLSLFNQLAGSLHTYYDTACMLITLVLLGKTLESRAKRRVLEALESFFALMPSKVRICTDQHPYGRYNSIGQLVPGDIYRVEAGEVVPADGRVLSGSGTVDEAAITGEPMPVAKSCGDFIRSGARIGRGEFEIRAQQVGQNSTLGQMIAIIEKTLLTKTPLEGKTDIILKWFVPTILVLAAATGVVCRLASHSTADAILRAVTVTVIACPCALGIAIPLARVAGVSLAGKLGILVRDFSAFEKSRRIDTVVFDKTGTLTEGRWTLLDIRVRAPFTPDQALCLAAGLEARSDHIIGQELRDSARKKDLQPLPVENLQVHQNGVCGTVAGRQAKIGSAEFVAADLEKMALSGPGEAPRGTALMSWIYLVVDGKLAAIFFFGDTLRAGADTVVAHLKGSGYDLALISGDGNATTQAVGRLLGIEESLGDQTAVDKAEFVRRLQANGRRVAMAGDGINDAAALVQADLSLAVYSGGQLGQEAADVTLMRSKPSQVIEFLKFGELVDKRIRQNLAFTFVYNVVAIPIAMGGYLSPLVAVCAMLLSSLSVTTNTLMLIRRTAPTNSV